MTRTLSVDPELHDALVPAMILQPIIENAYVHGLSKLDRGGKLYNRISQEGQQVKRLITNSGVGLKASVNKRQRQGVNGVGLANVITRLRLHYGDDCAFTIREVDRVLCRFRLHFHCSFRRTPPKA